MIGKTVDLLKTKSGPGDDWFESDCTTLREQDFSRKISIDDGGSRPVPVSGLVRFPRGPESHA